MGVQTIIERYHAELEQKAKETWPAVKESGAVTTDHHDRALGVAVADVPGTEGGAEPRAVLEAWRLARKTGRAEQSWGFGHEASGSDLAAALWKTAERQGAALVTAPSPDSERGRIIIAVRMEDNQCIPDFRIEELRVNEFGRPTWNGSRVVYVGSSAETTLEEFERRYETPRTALRAGTIYSR